MSRARTLADQIGTTKRDADERVRALRLQAMAWRHLAMIALVDQERARAQAKWLLFMTLPFTNEPEIMKYIADTEAEARDCAIKAGVCVRDGAEKE